MQEFLTNIGIAILASYFTTQLALKRFYSEKWWERKEKAYIEIIDALYDLIRYSEIKKEDYDQSLEYTSSKVSEFATKYNDAYWRIKKATDLGSFIISSEAELVLNKLRNKPQLDWSDNPSFDIYEADYNFYKQVLKEITSIAKNDLKIN